MYLNEIPLLGGGGFSFSVLYLTLELQVYKEYLHWGLKSVIVPPLGCLDP